jgi:uncharacterized protein (DUF1501 family)
MNRNSFLKLMGTTSGGLLVLPKFLTALNTQSLQSSFNKNKNILVIVQLNGGNDGLNTFIPFDDPLYYSMRPNIGIPKDQVLKAASSGMGFHPSMRGFADILQAGHLSVVQNVGYPNPNRSHFRSIEIWQTASGSNDYLNTGWLGMYLDANCPDDDPLGALNIDNIDNLALMGQQNHTLTMQDPQRFERMLRSMNTENSDPIDENPNLDFVRKLMIGTFEGSDQIKQALDKAKNGTTYPKHKLAQNLSWISKMIKGDLPTSVYYTGFGSFDTHANQLPKHKQLLTEVSESIKAFYDDMVAAGLLGNVTLMVFSEFGRRVKENGAGTDHGAAAPVFVIGGKGGIIGHNPNMSDLVNGDLKHQYDFRSIYGAILKEKMGVDPATVGIGVDWMKGLF